MTSSKCRIKYVWKSMILYVHKWTEIIFSSVLIRFYFSECFEKYSVNYKLLQTLWKFLKENYIKLALMFRYCEKATKFWKISQFILKVTSKQSGRFFFKFFWLSLNIWTLENKLWFIKLKVDVLLCRNLVTLINHKFLFNFK